MAVFDFLHPELGPVHVTEHATSRRYSARWKNNTVKVVCPRGSSEAAVKRAVEKLKAGILEMRMKGPGVADVDMTDWSITVGSQSLSPRKIHVLVELPSCKINIGNELDLDSTHTLVYYNHVLHAIGKKVAPKLLLPQAVDIAERIGVSPSSWKISHGHNVLGYCNARKEIALSYVNVFLPPRLREYIICHEMAHLTHMDHSPEFHALCNSYLNGREKQLIKEIRNYRWPIRR